MQFIYYSSNFKCLLQLWQLKVFLIDSFASIVQNNACRLCDDNFITNARVLQHPYNWRNVVVLGSGEISQIDESLKILLEGNPEFAKFNIITSQSETASKVNQLHVWQRSLLLDRETTSTGHATCELLVQLANQQVIVEQCVTCEPLGSKSARIGLAFCFMFVCVCVHARVCVV